MSKDEMIKIAPKGILAFELMDEFDRMLLEQRQELARSLMLAAEAVGRKDSFDLGVHLSDALCLCGFQTREEK